MKRMLFLVLVLTVVACAHTRGVTASDLVFSARSVELSGALNLAAAQKAAARLLELDALGRDPILLRIDAHGDSVEAAFALIDVIRAIQSPVHAVVQSRAYDMAAAVALHCDRTLVFPHAVMLLRAVQTVSTEVKPPVEPDAEFLARFVRVIHGGMAQRLKLTREAYEARVAQGWWLLADDALQAGAADAVVAGMGFREIVIEETEVKTTVTTVEDRTQPPAELLPPAPARQP